jgi:hypothetical protein
VKAYGGNAVDEHMFGIIALTKEQADILHGPDVLFSPSYESFRNSLTTERIEAAIAVYQEMGQCIQSVSSASSV